MIAIYRPPRHAQGWLAFARVAALEPDFPVRPGIVRLLGLMGRPIREAKVLIRFVETLRAAGVNERDLIGFSERELREARELVGAVKRLLQVELASELLDRNRQSG